MRPRVDAIVVQSRESTVPLRMFCSGTDDSAESNRIAISLLPISSEKNTDGRSFVIDAARAKSSASVDFPMAGRAATMIICPGWNPLVRSSRSAKPVGTPVNLPSVCLAASISSIATVTASESGT